MTLRLALVVAVLTAVRALADEPQPSDPASASAVAPERSNLEQHFGTDRTHLGEAGQAMAGVARDAQGADRSNLDQHFGADLQHPDTGQGVARVEGSGPDASNLDQHFGTERFGSEQDVGSAGGETSR